MRSLQSSDVFGAQSKSSQVAGNSRISLAVYGLQKM